MLLLATTLLGVTTSLRLGLPSTILIGVPTVKAAKNDAPPWTRHEVGTKLYVSGA